MTLVAKGLGFSYGHGSRRLSGIDLDLSEGQVLCLLGPNGAGKTTLLRCLTGALCLSAGSVTLGGVAVASLGPREMARKLAYVPQVTQPAFGHTLHEMVLMGRTAHLGRLQVPGRKDAVLADTALERVGLQHLRHRNFASVSGGERQLCMIARALAQEARLMIMDEPAASLDFGNQVRLLEIIAGLRRDGFGILMCTHHPDHALQVGTGYLALKEGGCHSAGPISDLARDGHLSGLYGRPVRILRDAEGLACVAQIQPV